MADQNPVPRVEPDPDLSDAELKRYNLDPGINRHDFARHIIISLHGGVYLDHDYIPIENPHLKRSLADDITE